MNEELINDNHDDYINNTNNTRSNMDLYGIDVVFQVAFFTLGFTLIFNCLNKGRQKIIDYYNKKSQLKEYMYNNNNNNNNTDNVCCICIEEFMNNDKLTELNCKHIYHTYCINEWFEKDKTCPICRHSIL